MRNLQFTFSIIPYVDKSPGASDDKLFAETDVHACYFSDVERRDYVF